ncbi:DeoR/GlpR family DNA-binding transcription regulator [Salsuginibacillus kocurii]|uniref:DeoR/GlpR family DNA-binding transcription regulator n=1 Tax=Salsuginibacillus kocurii TaxID=427078 RepID=UPI00036FB7A2|nr:DeoR/GlpR family DNA-binding transcription regulator [Salsuginibacillus kocurii]
MLTVERQTKIREMLKEKEMATIHELVETTGSSESTIRRDLTEMEERRELKRVRGGAALLKRRQEEPALIEKQVQFVEEKQQLAHYAASLIKQQDCIFLDAGTTILYMIPHLKDREITVVTNGITHVPLLLEHSITTYVTGGKAKEKTSALVGHAAAETLKNYRFDACFLGVNAVDDEAGYTTPDPEESVVKQTALQVGNKNYVLADHSKMGETAFAHIAPLHAATLVTTEDISEDHQQRYSEYTEIKVVKS